MIEDRSYTRVKFEYENEFGDVTTFEDTCHEIGEDFPINDIYHLTEEFVKFAKACTFHPNSIREALIECAENLLEG